MKNSGLRALLLSDEADRLYASGFHTTDGAVLILQDKAYYITDSRYIEAANEAVRDAVVLMSSTENKEKDIIKRLLTENSISELGAQEESLSYAEYLRTEKALGVKLVPAQKLCSVLRQVKERFEVESIVKAQRIAEKALDYVLGIIKPGISEKEIAAELEYFMAKGGAEGLAFETICVSGANSSRPHGVPGAKKIETGDFVTMDFGCKINGYCSDMTRTVAVGSVSDEMRRVYETVLSAQLAGIDAARAGIIGKDMDTAAPAMTTSPTTVAATPSMAMRATTSSIPPVMKAASATVSVTASVFSSTRDPMPTPERKDPCRQALLLPASPAFTCRVASVFALRTWCISRRTAVKTLRMRQKSLLSSKNCVHPQK